MSSFNTQMSALADSIRTKAGVTYSMNIAAMKTAVDSIQTGGGGGDIGKLIDRTITSVTIPTSTSLIGKYVFAGCTALSSVTILEGCRSIQDSAFWSCTDLSSIEIPKSVNSMCAGVFGSCTSLKTVSMGLNVYMSSPNETFLNISGIHLIISSGSDYTNIASGKFRYYNWFGKVTIPDSVSGIYDYAFASCYNLSRVVFGNNVNLLGSGTFCRCSSLASIYLPELVSSVPDDMCSSCVSLRYASMIDDVTTIGDRAFANCSNLAIVNGDQTEEVTSSILPSSLVTIGSSAFAGTSLTKVIFPNTLTSVCISAFAYCSSLEDFTLPSTAHVHAAAFQGCESLKTVNINYVLDGTNVFTGCTRLRSAIFSLPIASGQYSIPERTFGNCTTLSDVKFEHPEYIVGINRGAFSGTHLSEISLGSTAEHGEFSAINDVGSEAFACCSYMSKVDFAGKISTISEYAFSNCPALASFNFTSVTAIYDQAFASCTDLNVLSLPDTVSHIRNYAFGSCFHMSSAYLGSGFVNYVSASGYSRAIASDAFKDTALTYISCNFSSNAVPGAPWGAPAGCTVVYKA